jgi:hypothetical protein
LLVTNNALLKARAYNAFHANRTGTGAPMLSSPWSGLATLTVGVVTSPALIAYTNEGSEYKQNFDALISPGLLSMDAANPVDVAGSADTLDNPFGFALPVRSGSGSGGLGLDGLEGWYGWAELGAKFGASAGDQSTGGIIGFGPTTTNSAGSNRALGLLATSSTGATAFGARFVNGAGQTLNQISVQFSAELWRQSAVAKALEAFYWIDPTGTNSFPSYPTNGLHNLDVRFPPDRALSKPLAVDGSTPPNRIRISVDHLPISDWPPQAAFWLVWRMRDASPKGQGLAIDNLSFSAFAARVNVSFDPSSRNAILTWPAASSGAVVESSESLDAGQNWNAVPLLPQLSNGVNVLTLPATNPQQFFRLRN